MLQILRSFEACSRMVIIMNEAVRLILSLSLSGSILALLVFAIKPFIKHRLPKSVQYYIWIIILLRMVLPFSIEGSIMNHVFYKGQQSVDTASVNKALSISETVDIAVDSTVLPEPRRDTKQELYNGDIDYGSRYLRDSIHEYILLLWLLGAAATLALNLAGYMRFTKCLKQGNRPAGEEIRILHSLTKGRKNIRLMRNRFVSTPILIGIIRPQIIIPDMDFDERELKNILIHEISHLKRFDIAVKWLTMAAASVHWFNPLMPIIRKEVNRACELACDEAAIRNFSIEEKQAYGSTLISVAAEHKYPAGVIQATMCEEKENLKERLTSIMKESKKSKPIIVLSLIILAAMITGAVILGASIGTARSTPPDIYISAEYEKTKEAILGTYEWKYFNNHINADSDHPVNFKYRPNNILSAAPSQQLIISTQKINIDKKYDFTLEQLSVYKDGREIEFNTPKPHYTEGTLYIQAPPYKGEYIYSIVLGYRAKGTASYGFVVRVGIPTYDLEEIAKNKTPYIGNHVKVSGIAGSLPVPDHSFRQRYISMITKEKPYKLTIYYETVSDEGYQGQWPITYPDSEFENISRKNALLTFCMIDNLDEVTFAFRNSPSEGDLDTSKYDCTFTFQRVSFEEKYGDLSALGENLSLLRDALEGKKSAFKGLELYVWRKPGLTGNYNLYYTLLQGTNRNKTESEIYDLSKAVSDLEIIKKELSGYASGTHLFIRHNKDIDKEIMIDISDQLRGIIENGVISKGSRDI